MAAKPIIKPKARPGSLRVTWKSGTTLAFFSTALYFIFQREGIQAASLKGLSQLIERALSGEVPLRKRMSLSATPSSAAFAPATVVYMILTSAFVAWVWNKLDVQPGQSDYPAHRPFQDDMTKWNGAPADPGKSLLHPVQYRNFELSKRFQVSHNVYRFVFALPRPQDVLNLPAGRHISVRAEVDGEVVSRSYTPISDIHEKGNFELLIKVYPNGALTNKYLQKLHIGDKVEIRGPMGVMTYQRGLAKHLLMIAGGTGITPMYQIIKKIVQDPKDETFVSLLYANNNEDDILLREELNIIAAKWPTKLKLQYVLLNAPSGFPGGTGFVTEETIRDFRPTVIDGVKVLICGPPAMVEAQKKNLASLNYQLPGALAKPSDQVYVF